MSYLYIVRKTKKADYGAEFYVTALRLKNVNI